MSSSPYHAAGRLLNQILEQKKSIKTVAFSKSKLTCSKATYATVCNTIQNKPNIDSILNHSNGKLRKLIEVDKARNQGLIYVLLYEFLFGPYGNIRGGGKLKRMIVSNEKALKETMAKLIKSGDSASVRIIPTFPRYIRVNKLKATTEEVVKALQEALEKYDTTDKDQKGTSRDIYVDAHVPDLLVVSPKGSIPWHELDIVKEGKVILQDKSSCFSALAMAHGHHGESGPQGDFIDACAAPGNKTSHLAALVYDQKQSSGNSKKSKIFGFDRSSARLAILKSRMSQLAPLVTDPADVHASKKNKFPVEICPTHQDFLKAEPSDKTYSNVKSILLDPSCSGSGIVNQPDRVADAEGDDDEKRIESLSNFQLVALKHAMSFPNVDRIVYSTCSLHQRENEDVVAASMMEANELIEDDGRKWRLVSPKALMHWKRRGFENDGLTEEESKCLIRVNGLDGDDTNGFFVSYFERVDSASTDESVDDEPPVTKIIDGVKGVYNGEFRVAISLKKKDKQAPKFKDNDNDNTENQEKSPAPKAGKGSNVDTPKAEADEGSKVDKKKTYNKDKIIPKKAAKRNDWKKKQMGKKNERLQKQKTAKKAALKVVEEKKKASKGDDDKQKTTKKASRGNEDQARISKKTKK